MVPYEHRNYPFRDSLNIRAPLTTGRHLSACVVLGTSRKDLCTKSAPSKSLQQGPAQHHTSLEERNLAPALGDREADESPDGSQQNIYGKIFIPACCLLPLITMYDSVGNTIRKRGSNDCRNRGNR